MAAEYSHGNANSLQQILEDKKIDVRPFPDDVLQHLKRITREIVEEMAAADPAMAKIGTAYYAYLDKMRANTRISEQAYLDTRKEPS